ncbi:MAG TPA: hypothetical protein VJU16_08605, partial [Planctomycetota bacterium]|nr:hypothetical protein [Planctomycetota bacterium]
GNVKDEKGLWDESIKDFQKALSCAPPRWEFRPNVEESILTHPIKPVFREARGLHRVKKYREAIETYLPLVEKYPKTRYGRTGAFNIACAYALLGEKTQALDWFEKSIDAGYSDYRHTLRDTDLDSLRDDERFRELMERLKRAEQRQPVN